MNTAASLYGLVTRGLPVAGRNWKRLVEAALDGCEVSGANVIPLILIARAGGGLRQGELAEQVGVVGPSLVRQLDRLCGAGLVRREVDRLDRRANTLWLTEQGDQLARQMEVRLDALRESVLGTMSVEDLEAVLRLQRVLSAAVAAQDAKPEPPDPDGT